MPNKKLESFRVPRVKGIDKRIKLTNEQRAEIRDNSLGLSQRGLAEKYGVSRRTIQFIIAPDKHAQNLQRRAERGGAMQYYDKEKHAEYMRTHRAHKAVLLHKQVQHE